MSFCVFVSSSDSVGISWHRKWFCIAYSICSIVNWSNYINAERPIDVGGGLSLVAPEDDELIGDVYLPQIA